MILEILKAALLGGIWGCLWAAFMQFTSIGWLISTRQTWLGVVLGCGGNLLILAIFLPLEQWILLAAVFAGSSLAVGVRSLHNQHRELDKMMGAISWQQTERLQEQD